MYSLSREQKIANLQEQIEKIDSKVERLLKQKKDMQAKLDKLSANSGVSTSATAFNSLLGAANALNR